MNDILDDLTFDERYKQFKIKFENVRSCKCLFMVHMIQYNIIPKSNKILYKL